jgi:hypothetical protein
MAPLFEFGS